MSPIVVATGATETLRRSASLNVICRQRTPPHQGPGARRARWAPLGEVAACAATAEAAAASMISATTASNGRRSCASCIVFVLLPDWIGSQPRDVRDDRTRAGGGRQLPLGKARRPEGGEHEGEHEQPGGAGDEVGGDLEASRLAPEAGAEPRVGVLCGARRVRLVELAARRPGDRAQRPGVGP